MEPDTCGDQSRGSSDFSLPKEPAATPAGRNATVNRAPVTLQPPGTVPNNGEPTTSNVDQLKSASNNDVSAAQPQPTATSARRIDGGLSLAVRNDMVQKAVEFLLSRQVLASSKPLQDKVDFLIRKGLTADEVAEAVQRARLAGVSLDSEETRTPGQYPPANVLQPALPLRAPPPPPVPATSRAKRLALTAAAVGAFAYGAYHVYTVYVKPFVSSKLDRRSSTAGRNAKDALTASVEQVLGHLNESVTQLSRTIADQQQLLLQLAARVDGQKAASGKDDRPAPSFEELKSEILSVKRILLSKSQFPPVPVSSPILPAWQIESAKSIRESSTNVGHVSADASITSESGSAAGGELSSSSETSGSGQSTTSSVCDQTLTSGPMPSGTSLSAATGTNENADSSFRGDADQFSSRSESSSYLGKPDAIATGDTA